ncbi:hypothetical protein BDZ85DRAFT_32752 [Elsinoe ampelina]|uniref:Uncharacterized protein n=1 Tax=Elsinoe ampelina TaxID=302913 RepID=A0A6A6G346_9PEZI|nr:hypothetical protein BDZ85DRAFT_32752 [Elsinoe ampelina]
MKLQSATLLLLLGVLSQGTLAAPKRTGSTSSTSSTDSNGPPSPPLQNVPYQPPSPGSHDTNPTTAPVGNPANANQPVNNQGKFNPTMPVNVPGQQNPGALGGPADMTDKKGADKDAFNLPTQTEFGGGKTGSEFVGKGTELAGVAPSNAAGIPQALDPVGKIGNTMAIGALDTVNKEKNANMGSPDPNFHNAGENGAMGTTFGGPSEVPPAPPKTPPTDPAGAGSMESMLQAQQPGADPGRQ